MFEVPALPRPLLVTPYSLAQRFVGVEERQGLGDNHPLITWWLSLCGLGRDQPDETPWCAALVNGIAWELRLPRSKSAAARSWLRVGTPIELDDAEPGFDVVVLKRGAQGSLGRSGPEVLQAPGHVGFFAKLESSPPTAGWIWLLGGNQSDSVSLARFPVADLLGVRRLE